MVTQTQTFPVRDLKGPVPRLGFTPNPLLPPAGVGVVEQPLMHADGVQHIRLNLTSVVISITDALAYGSALLGYMPNRNFVFVGGELNITAWTKDGVGIVTGELPKLAVGTVIASNATLSSTMSNLINGGSTGGTAVAAGLTGTFDIHSCDNATPGLVFMPNSATLGIFLNSSVNPTGDGTLTVTGTLDMYFIDLGNVNT